MPLDLRSVPFGPSLEAESVQDLATKVREEFNEIRLLLTQINERALQASDVGNGAVSNHSALSELDYASSGHTGFASSEQLTATNQTVAALGQNNDFCTVAMPALPFTGAPTGTTWGCSIHGLACLADWGMLMPCRGDVRAAYVHFANVSATGTGNLTFNLYKLPAGGSLTLMVSVSYALNAPSAVDGSTITEYGAGVQTFDQGDQLMGFMTVDGTLSVTSSVWRPGGGFVVRLFA